MSLGIYENILWLLKTTFKGLDFKWSWGTFENNFTSKVIFKNGKEENQVPNITVGNIKHRTARQERKKGS